jgi:hypothetical protein
MGKSHLYLTALGNFYQNSGAVICAKTAYLQALQLSTLPVEQKVIKHMSD